MSLARAAYTLLLYLLTPAFLFKLWWRGGAEPGYRQGIDRRLGWNLPQVAPGALWIHAVSLGETLAAAPLVAALRQAQPDLRLLLTHGTATGWEAGRRLLQPGDLHTWLPWDTPGAVGRFLRAFQPSICVLMETEIWPNLLAGARQAGIPVVLANARLNERSARQARRFSALLGEAAAAIDLALAQTEADASRLRAAGVGCVEVLGNVKFDMAPDERLQARGRAWRRLLARPVVALANSRDGEEAQLLEAWAAAQRAARRPEAESAALAAKPPLLLIVPRHPQRFDLVAAQVRQAGHALARRSGWQDTPAQDALEADVWIGDSLGEMAQYYSMADIALLGGSFLPLGGHNLIEAAANACPLVVGPSTFNFADAAEGAVAAGAALRVTSLSSAVHLALQQLHAPAALAAMASAAQDYAGSHRGASARMARAVLARSRLPGRISAPASD